MIKNRDLVIKYSEPRVILKELREDINHLESQKRELNDREKLVLIDLKLAETKIKEWMESAGIPEKEPWCSVM